MAADYEIDNQQNGSDNGKEGHRFFHSCAVASECFGIGSSCVGCK
jgi:hypothetical protein